MFEQRGVENVRGLGLFILVRDSSIFSEEDAA